MKTEIRGWVRKSWIVAGASTVLVAGSLATTASASARPAASPAAPLATPACVDQLPPTAGFYLHERYSQPRACEKCQSAGAFYESLGRWDAHCRNIYNPGGTVTAVLLYLKCLACRDAAGGA